MHVESMEMSCGGHKCEKSLSEVLFPRNVNPGKTVSRRARRRNWEQQNDCSYELNFNAQPSERSVRFGYWRKRTISSRSSICQTIWRLLETHCASPDTPPTATGTRRLRFAVCYKRSFAGAVYFKVLVDHRNSCAWNFTGLVIDVHKAMLTSGPKQQQLASKTQLDTLRRSLMSLIDTWQAFDLAHPSAMEILRKVLRLRAVVGIVREYLWCGSTEES